LHKLSNHAGDTSYYCSFCKRESNVEDDELRSKGKIIMSEGPIEEPAVTLLPEVGLKRKNKEPKGTFRKLQERGIKITDYKERGWRKQNDE
jgi:hypothetical protein